METAESVIDCSSAARSWSRVALICCMFIQPMTTSDTTARPTSK